MFVYTKPTRCALGRAIRIIYSGAFRAETATRSCGVKTEFATLLSKPVSKRQHSCFPFSAGPCVHEKCYQRSRIRKSEGRDAILSHSDYPLTTCFRSPLLLSHNFRILSKATPSDLNRMRDRCSSYAREFSTSLFLQSILPPSSTFSTASDGVTVKGENSSTSTSTSATAVDNENSNRNPTTSATPSSTATSTLSEHLQALSDEDKELISRALEDPSSQKESRMGGGGIGPATAEMVAAFTCGRCEFRMVKRFSKHAYTKGIVVVQCPNCEVKHLLADNLGWWHDDESKNVEDFLREKGEKFIHLGGGDYQVYGEENKEDVNTPEAGGDIKK